MLMASTILSGNNYQKVALLAKFINLGLPHRTTFQKIQGHFVAPTVEQYWSNIQASTIEETRATNVVISGDGRMDSPGHCAKYCTYTCMNQQTKWILAMEVVDKRECQLKVFQSCVPFVYTQVNYIFKENQWSMYKTQPDMKTSNC
ncbi:uncharacterized protein LOC127849576 [Dreissena polymorpha]|uniref:uncharacterized protein LOC127849576 n=1 Tax=Dreissena polymorpha TaxID=45954 RepID=UPI002265090F|nr:uncharacterized protein LOC127849576 [Dreissena polymorpha]